MRRLFPAATSILATMILATMILATVIVALMAAAPTHAASAVKVPLCRAQVVHSEELPYAPQGSWLARVTLAVVPPQGAPFTTTVTRTIPWQQSAPRFGDMFWLRCDPASAELL